MTTLAFDTETALIRQAELAPPLVCLSYALGAESGVIHHKDPACRRFVVDALESDLILVGQNVPYDVGVLCNKWPDLLPLFFSVYEQDRICDSATRQKLIDIAKGCYRGYKNAATGLYVEHRYDLASLSKRHVYPVVLDKDTWRLRYVEFLDVPVEQWPESAVEYPRHDACATLHVWQAQQEELRFLDDQYRQARSHFALHLISAWGIRTDRVMVEKLFEITKATLADHEAHLFEQGLLRREKKSGRVVKSVKEATKLAEAAWAKHGGAPKNCLTDKGKISLSEDAVNQLGDDTLMAFQQYANAGTVLARVEELRAGVDLPIHTRFEELMETGRSSSSKPNIQARAVNPSARPVCGHKKVKKKYRCPGCGEDYDVAGDRESFVPRCGKVYYITDVPGLELRTIGQTCIKIVGRSSLAEALNAGRDPHLEVGANLLGISFDEAYLRKRNLADDLELYRARQTGKVVNFGLNARLGWRGLIEQARTKYEVVLDERGAKRAIEVFHVTWDEFKDFFRWVDTECGRAGVGTIAHLFSNRYRGLIPPTVMSNTFSQGLGADATKHALYELVKECYVGGGVLRGSRVVNYGHDEYLMEGNEDDLMEERADAMARVVTNTVNLWLPDVPVPLAEMAPIVCRRWSKKARIVRNSGQLGVWEWDVATKLGSKGCAT